MSTLPTDTPAPDRPALAVHDLPVWTFVLVVIASLATCAIVNVSEDAALAACYGAGFSPAECER